MWKVGLYLTKNLCSPSNYNINTSLREYAFKSNLKIKWIRPEKIPCQKPEKSGDLQKIGDVDSKGFPLQFSDSQELLDADEMVKKMFSLGFLPRKYSTQVLRHEMVCTVQRHHLDFGSMESRIASMTSIIRNWQELYEQFPRNKKLNVRLKELIDKRKKFLKYLRRWDYKRYEWLLSKLDVVYHPPPNEFRRVTRKESLCKLTDKYCNDLKEQRLKQYKATLESQQIEFLRDKIKLAIQIRTGTDKSLKEHSAALLRCGVVQCGVCSHQFPNMHGNVR
ncbi:unnamed protein product [Timema podura]|uniref:Small ribosomal subunit protein uS15m n=1 Tax=Timema podura TaxID=61482 RepID=A0ABN7NP29_TIMPD|nr:unnamed protein product [Timema podura]